MARSPLSRLLATTLASTLILAAGSLHVDGATRTSGNLFVIEPSSTRAGIARVHLEIEDLRQTGELLEGTYSIRVPLLPGKNDTGHIVLHAPGSLDDRGGAAAAMTGRAVSSTGQVHEVVARIQPDGVVRIQVVTPKRTLRFTSRYAQH